MKKKNFLKFFWSIQSLVMWLLFIIKIFTAFVSYGTERNQIIRHNLKLNNKIKDLYFLTTFKYSSTVVAWENLILTAS